MLSRHRPVLRSDVNWVRAGKPAKKSAKRAFD
jgi:hypothetical protein